MKPEVFFVALHFPFTGHFSTQGRSTVIIIIIILVTGDRYDCKLWSSLSKN